MAVSLSNAEFYPMKEQEWSALLDYCALSLLQVNDKQIYICFTQE